MAVGTSLTDQIGLKSEATWNTLVTPDHFLFPVEKPDFEPDVRFIETMPYGQYAMPSDAVRNWEFGGAGTIVTDARIKGLGILLLHLLGAVSTSGAGPYTHVFTPAANPGLSATIQQGRTLIDGTIKPFNFTGCVCISGELAITSDQNPRLTTVWDVGGHEVTTALATASYPSGATPFSFLDGGVTFEGGAACARSLRIRVTKATATDRMCIGGSKRQQILNGEYVVDGDIELEFESMVAYNRWRAGTTAALSTALTYGASSLTVAAPVIQYRSNGFGGTIGDVVVETIGFKALKGGSALTTWTYITADALP
jgi:hypothetical protein